jgi:DNA adenine methylase
VDHFPENYAELTYVEPFAGGASVLLNKKRSAKEIISDIDVGVVSILKSLRDEPKEFVSRIKRVKYCEKTFLSALRKEKEPIDDYVDRSINEFILRRMSRGGMRRAFAWSERKRGGQPGDINAWDTIIDQLPRIAERLQDVVIVKADFRKMIDVWDEEDSLFYLDPPYLHTTRSEGSIDIYEHEMSAEDHIAMLTMIKNIRGKVLISGYQSSLYTRMLDGSLWHCGKKSIAAHASQSKTKTRRTEYLWYNFSKRKTTE